MAALPARHLLRPSPTPRFDDLFEFLLSQGRLPKLGDARPPWSYCGLLLEYVRLLTELIPHLEYATPHPTPLKALNRCIDHLACREGAWEAFHLFVNWLAWMLGVSTTPSTLSDTLQEYLYRNVNLGPLLEHPSDYLGAMLSDNRQGSWNPHAFFLTPHAVCEMMVRMTLMPTSTICLEHLSQFVWHGYRSLSSHHHKN
ncbi:MAG: hypothetical protein KC643_13340 [Nitrospira sp.]|nr:hypothetical protein [Nitrospira sp.]